MALFSSKIALGIIASGTVTLGGLGLLYTGSDTLQNATKSVQDLGARIVQFENNENVLANKIGEVKTDAEGKLTAANGNISTLNTKVAELNTQITTLTQEKADLQTQVQNLTADVIRLEGDITTLRAELAKEQGDHSATKAALQAKTDEHSKVAAELAAAKTNLSKAEKKIKDYEAAARVALEQARKADGLVKQLEGEVQKANEDAANHGEAVETVKEETAGDLPMSQDELDAIDTTIDVEVTPVAENK